MNPFGRQGTGMTKAPGYDKHHQAGHGIVALPGDRVPRSPNDYPRVGIEPPGEHPVTIHATASVLGNASVSGGVDPRINGEQRGGWNHKM